MISPVDFLAERLSDITDDGLEALAVTAGIDIGVARRARSGEPISASAALALIAARGYDPVTRKMITPRRLRPLDCTFLALGVKGAMFKNKHTARQAAAAMDVSATAVTRLRNGHKTSIVTVLKACAYIGVHPFDQCETARREQARAA